MSTKADRGVPPTRYPGEAPRSLPVSSAALIRRLQLDILRTELVAIADAQEADETEWRPDVGTIGPGALLARAVRSRLDRAATAATDAAAGLPALRPAAAMELFRRYNVGRERIGDDVGSDLFSMTLAHTLAVSSAMAAAPSGGLGRAKHLLRMLRGVTLVFYVLVRNVTLGSRTGAALTAAAITAGATIVGLVALAGVSDLPGSLVAAGWLLLLGGALTALVRRFYTTVLIVAGGVVAYAVRDTWLGWFGPLEQIRPLGPLVVILAVTLTLYLLGSVRRPRWFGRRLRRRKVRARG